MKLRTWAAIQIYATKHVSVAVHKVLPDGNQTTEYKTRSIDKWEAKADAEYLIRECGDNPDSEVMLDYDRRNKDIHL